MTKQFKWWLAYSIVSAILTFGINVLFLKILPDVYLAVSLLETIVFSLIAIVFVQNLP